MPASRPSAGTAVINTGDTISSKINGLWLADATGSIPDLHGVQSSLTLSGTGQPAYSSGGLLGGQLTGNTTDLAYATISPTINSWGWAIGCVAAYSTTPGTTLDTWFSFGDAGHDSGGVFGGIFVDNGTFGASGKIVALFRAVNGGTVGQINGPSFSANTQYACGLQVDAPDGNVGRLVVNGTAYTSFSNFPESSFGTDSFGNIAMCGSKRQTTSLFPASSNSKVAMGWYAAPGSGINSTVLVNWTNDPWNSVQSPGGGGGGSNKRNLFLLGVG